MLRRRVTGLVARVPGADALVARYVPGADPDGLVAACKDLVADGLVVAIELLAVPATDEDSAEATASACIELIEALARGGVARRTEISVTPCALGLTLPETGGKVSLENAGLIARTARAAGAMLLLDLTEYDVVEPALEMVRELRKDFGEVGVGISANWIRSEHDCRALAYEGSRVLLSKGPVTGPAPDAYDDPHEVDRSYVRCLKVLMAGQGHPVVATHDPRIVRIASALATRFDRQQGSFEYQMRFGIRGEEQRRLAASGERVRVAVPYGQDPYDYVVGRLVGRPAGLRSFVRSLVSQK